MKRSLAKTKQFVDITMWYVEVSDFYMDSLYFGLMPPELEMLHMCAKQQVENIETTPPS